MRTLPYIFGLSFVSAVGAWAATVPSPSDFLTDAIKGDNSEIMLGQYAADHGSSAATKEFGRVLVADHSKAKKQADQVAEQLGVATTTETTPAAQAEMQKLQSLQGVEFDRQFASYMTNDHKKDIATFKAEADAKNGPASRLAVKQLPVLRKHLRMAEALEKKEA